MSPFFVDDLEFKLVQNQWTRWFLGTANDGTKMYEVKVEIRASPYFDRDWLHVGAVMRYAGMLGRVVETRQLSAEKNIRKNATAIWRFVYAEINELDILRDTFKEIACS